jgi:hypothetical protein
VRDAPSVVLKVIPDVMRVEQVDQVGMGAFNDKIKAKCLQKDLFYCENLVRDLVYFL